MPAAQCPGRRSDRGAAAHEPTLRPLELVGGDVDVTGFGAHCTERPPSGGSGWAMRVPRAPPDAVQRRPSAGSHESVGCFVSSHWRFALDGGGYSHAEARAKQETYESRCDAPAACADGIVQRRMTRGWSR
ncbi:hypothetical protein GCM10017687_70170 [Streptomyces echinatus]